MPARIAYLINQYPKVSHSFIRREILALERQGLPILRLALRGHDEVVTSAEDLEERSRTRYVLQNGIAGLLRGLITTMVTVPGRFLAALALALRMGWRADRAMPYHLAYLAEACRLVPWLRSFGATHVHAHFGTNSAEVAMLVRALGGPPYSFTVHGPEEFDKAQRLGIAEKVRRAAFVVAVSSHGRGQLFRWVKHEDWPKVKLVRCGLEPAFHEAPPAAPPEAPRLVCVGRLCEQKGQQLLLQATRQLASKGIALQVVLAGDGEMRAQNETLIAEYGLAEHVSITGWIGNGRVREEILAARGLVLASFAEGLPVALMESMALRRPVLATCVGGVPELVRPGENGWLFPAGDVDALAQAMEDCLTCPAERLRAMGEAARARVLQAHAIDVEAGKLAALFEATPRPDERMSVAWDSRF